MNILRGLMAGLLATVVLAASADVSAAVPYAITDLGSLGGTDTMAWAINDAGQVAGRTTMAGGEERAFLWDATQGIADLNLLAGGPLVARSARDINGTGQIVGGATTAGGSSRAFLWDQTGGVVDLGTLGGNSSKAFAVNESGRVVGRATTLTGETRPFLWENGSGMTDLGTLGGDAVENSARGINDAGIVVGATATGAGALRAFIWDNLSGIADLGTLGGNRSAAWDINGSGQVVGWSDTSVGPHPFLWSTSTGMIDLGTLGGEMGSAFGISGGGDVVGRDQDLAGEYRAFLWNAAEGMTDLNSLLDPADQAAWTLSGALGINDEGHIVGYGLHEGETHGFLATPITEVAIDINQKTVNLGAKGVLPVTIFGAESFDVHDVDLTSLGLAGSTPKEKGSGGVMARFMDADRDGFEDLILRFLISELDLEPGATQAELTGMLLDGTDIFGTDYVKLLKAGDANLDGFVDIQDFFILKANFDKGPAGWSEGDFNEDGLVDIQDFAALKGQFGSGGAAISPIPEPATAMLLCGAAGAVLLKRNRRSRR